MDTTHPTAGWEQVGDSFYRKVQLYTAVFDRDIDLDNYAVAGAPYSGAIALCRDDNKIVAYRGGQTAKPSIDIYSSAGKLIRSISWDKASEIRGLGWSDDEKLLIITKDGTVRCYVDLQGEFSQFSLGNGAEEYGVESCRYVGCCEVLCCPHLRLFVSNIYAPVSTTRVSLPCFQTIPSSR